MKIFFQDVKVQIIGFLTHFQSSSYRIQNRKQISLKRGRYRFLQSPSLKKNICYNLARKQSKKQWEKSKCSIWLQNGISMRIVLQNRKVYSMSFPTHSQSSFYDTQIEIYIESYHYIQRHGLLPERGSKRTLDSKSPALKKSKS